MRKSLRELLSEKILAHTKFGKIIWECSVSWTAEVPSSNLEHCFADRIIMGALVSNDRIVGLVVGTTNLIFVWTLDNFGLQAFQSKSYLSRFYWISRLLFFSALASCRPPAEHWATWLSCHHRLCFSENTLSLNLAELCGDTWKMRSSHGARPTIHIGERTSLRIAKVQPVPSETFGEKQVRRSLLRLWHDERKWTKDENIVFKPKSWRYLQNVRLLSLSLSLSSLNCVVSFRLITSLLNVRSLIVLSESHKLWSTNLVCSLRTTISATSYPVDFHYPVDFRAHRLRRRRSDMLNMPNERCPVNVAEWTLASGCWPVDADRWTHAIRIVRGIKSTNTVKSEVM